MTDDAIKQLANLDLNDPNAAAIMSKICIPHAEKNGAQEGRPSPAKMKYPSSKGKKPISSDEAIKRYREKISRGDTAYPMEQPDAQVGSSSPDDLDPFTGAEPVKEPEEEPKTRKRRSRADVTDRLLELIVDKLALVEAAKAVAEREAPVANTANTPSDVLSAFKRRHETIKIKLSTGQVTMPCLAVQQEAYGITVFMDDDANGFVFVPESGTEVHLSWGGRAPVKAYFPGAQFTIPTLGITGMVFLSDPDEKPLPVEEAKPAVKEPPKPSFKFNPESGMEEDEFGLTKV